MFASENPLDVSVVVSQREKWGFYLFGFATEPFYSTAMAVAIPILLETLSANAGFKDDLKTPCNTNVEYSCKVHFLGSWIDTSSFTLYTTAVSVAIQAIIFVSLGAMADYGNLRKKMMFGFSLLSAVVSILFLTITKNSLYWLAALYTIIANVAFGASYVFYYAYIPTLTQYSYEIVEADKNGMTDIQILQLREKVANEISGKGFASSYLGAVINLLIAVAIIIVCKDVGPVSTYPLQIATAFTGLWMIAFMIVPAIWLKDRPNPPLPKGESYLIFSWKQVIRTVSHAGMLSQTFKFLLSWFIMSDAVATIVSVAILFAKKNLNFSLTELLIAALTVPIAAGIGSIFWNYIRVRFQFSTKRMILILTVLYAVLPIYGLLGLIPHIKFGLKTKPEIFIFAIYHGFLLGAIQSFYRVMYSEMLPPGKENEFFGLYEVTDKGSSWIGPLVVAAITDATNNIRYGFFFLVGSMVASFLITCTVDPVKGKIQARAYSPKLIDTIAYPLTDL